MTKSTSADKQAPRGASSSRSDQALHSATPASPKAPLYEALFISDLHLQDAMPRTAQAFLTVLQDHAVRAKRLYLLGDLFEYWAGDDDIGEAFHARMVAAIRAVADRGVEVFWIAGNRDFLVGDVFAAAIGAKRLVDPHTVQLAHHSMVLTHGDAYCTDDAGYMAFRAQVREPAWQQAFLSQPLAKRKEIIAGMREGSRAAQQMKAAEIMDVNPAAIDALFAQSGATVMIHGHTHRPGRHVSLVDEVERVRYVLPDWDCDTVPARGGWIVVRADGAIDVIDAGSFPQPEYDSQP